MKHPVPQPCPDCGYRLEVLIAGQHHHEPQAGDLTLCQGCATILVFNEDLTTSPARLRDLMRMDPAQHGMMSFAQQLIRSWRATQTKQQTERQ